jgi:hypothetical protein
VYLGEILQGEKGNKYLLSVLETCPGITGRRLLTHRHVLRSVAQPFLEHLANAITLHWQLQLDLFHAIFKEQLAGLLGHSH